MDTGAKSVGLRRASASAAGFCYEEAFSRNLGWLTAAEQQVLRGKKIAIAGMGGVGGSHLLTLTRLGIGAFSIADFDTFELANLNRQAGASMASLGKPKAETMAKMAREINPTLKLAIFHEGIDETNLDAFLSGVDVYVDSLDFFVLDLRQKLFARCHDLGIPVVIAGPIGMGTGYLVFVPGGMTFEQYFRLEGLSPERQRVNFALGLTPRAFQRSYLVDPSRIDLKGMRGPSTGIACELCAGVAAAEVVKLLLKRGRVRAAPWYHQFDAYSAKWKRGWLPGGNRNPIQRLKLAIAYRLSERLSRDAIPSPRVPKTDMEAILDAARWAPSGDNIQPWRFETVTEDRLIVHIKGTGDVYDYRDGEPTLLAAGFLLETLRVAASGRKRWMYWNYLGRQDGVHRISVELPRGPQVVADELLPFLPIRSVDRGAYRSAPLTGDQKRLLTEALGPGFSIEWHETLGERWRQARLNAAATDIRLRIPEAYAVHRKILDWERNFSPTGIPSTAIGLDPLARRLSGWLMRNWRRVDRANRLMGTSIARLEMDLIPGLFCAGHFSVRAREDEAKRDGPQFLIEAGQALQRFWLTAARLGLRMQPSLAPLCFAIYGRDHAPFTCDSGILKQAHRLAERMKDELGAAGPRVVFRGRVGVPASAAVSARSTRRELEELLVPGERAEPEAPDLRATGTYGRSP